MKDFDEKGIKAFLDLTTKKDTIEEIDFCLKHLYENTTKSLFDQVLGGSKDKFTFAELIGALCDAKYDLKYAQAVEFELDNKPVPKELLIELGLEDEPHLRRIK